MSRHVVRAITRLQASLPVGIAATLLAAATVAAQAPAAPTPYSKGEVSSSTRAAPNIAGALEAFDRLADTARSRPRLVLKQARFHT